MLLRLFVPLLLLLASCAEAKNQLRLGIGGSGSSYAPRQPDRPGGAQGAGAAGAGLQAVGQAVGAAAVSRALGGCVAACPPGTACNTQTGLCDVLPCRDQCKADEVCQNDRCVPLLLPGLQIQK
jgi:hypothetical protein